MTETNIMEQFKRDPLYQHWNRVGRYIAERQLTDQEIATLFGNIQQGMTAAGKNRTMIGKGVDAAKGVAQAWASLKDQVYNSGPMSGFATQYDRAAESLKQATGGDQGLFQYVQKYRDFAEKHPIMQKAVYGALVAAAGMVGAAGGPAGIGAAVGLMQTFDKALQGQDIRSAIWSGTKAGVTAAGTATLAQYMRSGDAATTTQSSAAPAATPADQAAQTVVGGARQQVFSQAQQAVNDAIKQGITNPGKLTDIAARAVDNLPVSMSTQTAIDKAVTSGLGQIAQAAGGQAALTQGQLVRESFDRVAQVLPLTLLPRRHMINRDATVMQWSLNESAQTQPRSVQLTDQAIGAIFENLGMWRAMILESDAPSAQKLRHHWNRPRMEAVTAAGRQNKATAAAQNRGFTADPANTQAPAPAAGGELSALGTVGAKRAAQQAQANVSKAYQASTQPAAAPAVPAAAPATAQKPGFFSQAWSGIKGAAQKAGAELTTKVTANRLQSNWNKVKEYDSDKLANWLTKAPQNVPQEVVADVFGKMSIPVPASMQAAPVASSGAAPVASSGAAPATAKPGKKTPSAAQQQYKQQSRDERLAKQGYTKDGGAAGIAASSSAAPTEKKVAREIDAEIDDLIRALRKVDSIAAPAYVKYIRDRLDQTFGPAAAAAGPTAPAASPKMSVMRGGAGASEPISIGGQKLDPRNPKDAELIAKARAAGAVAESLQWSQDWDPSKSLLTRFRDGK